jgi:hypothetical protein
MTKRIIIAISIPIIIILYAYILRRMKMTPKPKTQKPKRKHNVLLGGGYLVPVKKDADKIQELERRIRTCPKEHDEVIEQLLRETKAELKGFKAGQDAERKEELEWLKENRETIDGIDIIEVDKRIKKIESEK